MFSPGVDQGSATLDDRHLHPVRGNAGVPQGGENITVDLRTDREAATEKLLAVMRLRDPNLADHAQRTAEIAAAVAQELGLDRTELDHVYLGAQLHDVGKLGVSEAILWKPAGLTSAEWRQVRTHPEEGHRLVADAVHRDVASAVLYHHERMDGDGYPFGIDGRTLPITVRIVQVADAFDAMTSDRPYQRALPTHIAVAEIARCAASQFDPEVAEALGRVFDRHKEIPAIVDDAAAEEPVVGDGPPSDPFGSAGILRLTDRPA
ncbi:MAG TPA: HD domain-containing phosphohydrolase, partial [Acidimicrobiia bacterium]|nr:HD domain-containing phosphohydrolase [Acidimicrobiia bacterium]